MFYYKYEIHIHSGKFYDRDAC